jgi:AcrR family transcriptional regulator
MTSNRRTQAARSAATRDALVAAARGLFAARGYGDVGTEEIVRAAGLTRGALYHHFADKTELFAGVFELVEVETNARIADAVAASGVTDAVEAMRIGAGAFLDVSAEPEMAQIMLIDAPSVLGWEGWTEISNRHNMGLVHALLAQAIEDGRIPAQPIPPLAHTLLGALREAAIYLARAEDGPSARGEVGAVMDRLIDSLADGSTSS